MNNIGISLIIPCAGQSSRFPGKPKWLLNHPKSGNLLINECFQELEAPQEPVTGIYFVVLREHLIKWCQVYNALDLPLDKMFPDKNQREKIKFLVLDKSTSCQPETVLMAIDHFNLKGSIFVKDCDNSFNTQIKAINGVCCLTVTRENEHSVSNFASKSFIIMDENEDNDNTGRIANIIEKKISSNIISVGGYSFQDCSQFKTTFLSLLASNQHSNNQHSNNQHSNNTEIYLSNVIAKMISEGIDFVNIPVSYYHDWGTYEAWLKFTHNYPTLFIDINGTLVKNNTWEPIEKNISHIKNLRQKGAYIVLITTRTENNRAVTITQLEKIGFNICSMYDQLIMGIGFGKRILINDFSESAIAVNLHETLSELLHY